MPPTDLTATPATSVTNSPTSSPTSGATPNVADAIATSGDNGATGRMPLGASGDLGFELESDSAGHRFATLLVIVLPFVAFLVAIVLLWERAVATTDLILLLVMHTIAALGITVGFHRLLTHRSFETKPWIRGLLAAAGSLAVEGRPTHWVADHRRHHAFSDEVGDPHSPHAGRQPGLWGVVKAAFHAHVGWLMTEDQTPAKRFAPDLLKDRVVMKIDRAFPWFILLAFVIPALIGFFVTGFSWVGALTAAFWAGGVRMFMTHHITWSVNSICHMFGRRPYETGDRSTNNWVLALPTMGEAWHHNHHAFPTSAFHGLKRWQKTLDPSGWVVSALEKTGLAWNVRRVSPQQMAEKLRDTRKADHSVKK